MADSSGGVIANADVTVKNQGTNISSTGRSNENGRYVVPSLKPGLYTVAVSAPGFKKYVNTALTLQVNQTARLDIELTIGEVTQEVTVSAEAPLLEVDTSGRGAVIDQRKIVELPLNGRDYNQLAHTFSRSLDRHAAAAVGRVQGRVQCERQPGIPERLSVGWRGQHVVFELLPRRQHSGGSAVD